MSPMPPQNTFGEGANDVLQTTGTISEKSEALLDIPKLEIASTPSINAAKIYFGRCELLQFCTISSYLTIMDFKNFTIAALTNWKKFHSIWPYLRNHIRFVWKEVPNKMSMQFLHSARIDLRNFEISSALLKKLYFERDVNCVKYMHDKNQLDVNANIEWPTWHTMALVKTTATGSTLHWACDLSFHDFAMDLLNEGACLIDQIGTSSCTPLHLACSSGALQVVTKLVEMKAAIDPLNDLGETPLHLSAKFGRNSVIEYLSKSGSRGASMNDYKGCTPLHYAVTSGSLECIETLVKMHPSSLKVYNSETLLPIHIACTRGSYDIAKYLIEQDDATKHMTDSNETSCLHFAANSGSLELVKYLIDKGGKDLLMKKDKNLRTALHNAAHIGIPQLCKYLIENGADISAVCSEGNSVLHYAVLSGNPQVIEYLCIAGSDVNVRNNRHRTPLYSAVCHHRSVKLKEDDVIHSMVRILCKHGSEVNACDSKNLTPLAAASSRGLFHSLAYLVQMGANKEAVDLEGNSVLSLAANDTIKNFLIDSVEWEKKAKITVSFMKDISAPMPPIPPATTTTAYNNAFVVKSKPSNNDNLMDNSPINFVSKAKPSFNTVQNDYLPVPPAAASSRPPANTKPFIYIPSQNNAIQVKDNSQEFSETTVSSTQPTPIVVSASVRGTTFLEFIQKKISFFKRNSRKQTNFNDDILAVDTMKGNTSQNSVPTYAADAIFPIDSEFCIGAQSRQSTSQKVSNGPKKKLSVSRSSLKARNDKKNAKKELKKLSLSKDLGLEKKIGKNSTTHGELTDVVDIEIGSQEIGSSDAIEHTRSILPGEFIFGAKTHPQSVVNLVVNLATVFQKKESKFSDRVSTVTSQIACASTNVKIVDDNTQCNLSKKKFPKKYIMKGKGISYKKGTKIPTSSIQEQKSNNAAQDIS